MEAGASVGAAEPSSYSRLGLVKTIRPGPHNLTDEKRQLRADFEKRYTSFRLVSPDYIEECYFSTSKIDEENTGQPSSPGIIEEMLKLVSHGSTLSQDYCDSKHSFKASQQRFQPTWNTLHLDGTQPHVFGDSMHFAASRNKNGANVSPAPISKSQNRSHRYPDKHDTHCRMEISLSRVGSTLTGVEPEYPIQLLEVAEEPVIAVVKVYCSQNCSDFDIHPSRETGVDEDENSEISQASTRDSVPSPILPRSTGAQTRKQTQLRNANSSSPSASRFSKAQHKSLPRSHSELRRKLREKNERARARVNRLYLCALVSDPEVLKGHQNVLRTLMLCVESLKELAEAPSRQAWEKSESLFGKADETGSHISLWAHHNFPTKMASLSKLGTGAIMHGRSLLPGWQSWPIFGLSPAVRQEKRDMYAAEALERVQKMVQKQTTVITSVCEELELYAKLCSTMPCSKAGFDVKKAIRGGLKALL